MDKRVRSQIDSITYSVCPWCSGTTNTELVPASDTPLGDRPIETAVRHVCQHCEANGWTTVGQRLLAHPAVVSFHYLNDVAIADRPLRELAFAVTDRYTTVRDRDPLRIELSLELERDRLRATLDERADVIDLSRTFRIGPPSEQ